MAGKGDRDGSRRDSSRSETADSAHSGVHPAADNAAALTAFARQMGELRRRSTAKMRAIRDVDFALQAPTAHLVQHALGVAPGEHVLLVVERTRVDWANAFALALAECGASVTRVTLEDASVASGLPPSLPPVVSAALRDAAVVISARPSRCDGQVTRRIDLHRDLEQTAGRLGVRHLSLGCVSRGALLSTLSTPCDRTFERVAEVATIIRGASCVTVRSPAGTDLTISVSRHERVTPRGARQLPGDHLEVPFGRIEVTSSSVDGTYVVDASAGELESGQVSSSDGGVALATNGELTARPLRLELDRGNVTAVACADDSLARAVERFVRGHSSHQRVRRWVLGANVGCNAALGEVAHDWNAPGVHLTLGGDVAGARGLAFTMSRADVDVDGQALIRGGRFVRW